MTRVLIRELQSSDYQSLAIFNSNFPGDTRSETEWLARFKYWWDENPAYFTDHIKGVVLINDNEIVGCALNIPTRMLWGGKEVLVVSGTTWRVLPSYRKYSMDLWLEHRELTKDLVYFNTTPNETVKRMLKVLKFSNFQVAHTWFYYFGAPSIMVNSKVIHIGLNIIKCLTTCMIQVRRNFYKKLTFKVVTDEQQFDELHQLWIAHRADFEFTNVRDKRYLKWISESKLIIMIKENQNLLGYLILNENIEKKTVILVDYWGGNVKFYAKQIIIFMLWQYNEYNVIIPSYSPQFSVAAKLSLMIPRKSPSEGFVFQGKEIALQQNRCFFNMLQGDYGM